MSLGPILALVVAETVFPGRTGFSVEVATDCAPSAETCEGAKRSSFYGAWVRQESAATAAKRHALAMEVLDETAREVLCLDAEGNRTCKPSKAQLRWKLDELDAYGAAVAIQESGLREDVMVGRGFARKCPKGGPASIPGKCGPSDDGGMGRGPGGERCFMQIHPSVLNDDRLLGADREALRACFKQGLTMLVHARNYCAWEAPLLPWDYATVSLYGTGYSCRQSNLGKTEKRVELGRRLLRQMRAKARTLP